MAEETGVQEGEENSSGGGMMKKLLFGVIGLVLVAVGAFAGLMFMGGDEPEVDENGEPIVEEAEEEAKRGDGPVFYSALAPPLVVNFKDRVGDDHVMQVTLEMMARDQATINEVREHSALIRSSLILMYSGFIYEDVSTVEGKQKMLDDGLAEIQRLMEMRIGKPAIEELYFTGLVIQ